MFQSCAISAKCLAKNRSSKSGFAGRRVPEDLGIAHVPRYSGDGAVLCLSHDVEALAPLRAACVANPVLSNALHIPPAQTPALAAARLRIAPTESRWIPNSPPSRAGRLRGRAHPRLSRRLRAIDAGQRPDRLRHALLGDGDLPSLPCLVGLRAPRVSTAPSGHLTQIIDREGGEFRPAQSSRVADEWKRKVTCPGQAGGKMCEHPDEVCGEERRFAWLGSAEGPPDPLESLGNNGMLCSGWIRVTGGGVRLGDRGQPAGQGGGR